MFGSSVRNKVLVDNKKNLLTIFEINCGGRSQILRKLSQEMKFGEEVVLVLERI